MCQGCWKSVYFLYLGVPFLVVATIMTTVSMVAPYWRTGGGRDEGLFFYCDGGGCEGLDEISVGSEGRWKEGWRERE